MRRLLAIGFAVGACSLVSLKFAPGPYVFIAGCVVVGGFAASFVAAREWQRVLAVNVMLIALVFGAVEGYFLAREANTVEHRVVYPDGYQEFDAVLGYRPVAGASGRARRFAGEELVYDVVYTIGDNGLRVAPQVERRTPLEACALFFGDSFMYGEGVGNDEAIPFLIAQRSGGRVRAFNFAFHGYGPHQMLAALQAGQLDSHIDCRPTHAIYSAIPHHMSRAGGLAEFGRTGPRYRLREDGHVFRDGVFSDEEEERRRNHSALANAVLDELAWQASKSAAYRVFVRRERRAQDVHFDLFFAIVAEARDTALRNYPGLKFSVLLWPNDAYPGVNERLLAGLTARGLAVHPVGDIVPDYDSNRQAYELHPADRHPNAKTYSLIADYLLRYVVREGEG